MKITSPSYPHGGAIPRQFTCDGEGISPSLSWEGAPRETKSLVLIMHDPDAPKKDGFTHWVMYNIQREVNSIAENMPHNASLPGIGVQGRNDAGRIGYMGPCPPSGVHRYFVRLYALRSELALPPGAMYAELLSAMHGKIIEEAELMGTYAKAGQKAA